MNNSFVAKKEGKKMYSETGRMRLNHEGDRLSSLPDHLIHKILSFISIKHAVKTSVLSSLWRFIWTSMPYLNFSTEDFNTLPDFSKFVTHVLSRLNNQIQVSSVKLMFNGAVTEGFVKSITDYAFSHNVQQLNVSSLHENTFPLSIFSSRSLKHLTLSGPSPYQLMKLASTWELPALTTLHLSNVILFDIKTDHDLNIFSKCANLKNLTLLHCQTRGGRLFFNDDLSLCNPLLSNLTLIDVHCNGAVVIVVAPQLKNLTLINCIANYNISATHLDSLIYKGQSQWSLLFSEGSSCFLDKAHLYLYSPLGFSPSSILVHFQQLQNVKFLTLNLGIIQALSSSVRLISNQPSPFANLKSLKIYSDDLYWFNKKVTPPTEVIKYSKVINYLLDSSLTTSFTIITHKDFRTHYYFSSADNLMSRLHTLLEQKKSDIKTNRKSPTEGPSTHLSYQDSSSNATCKIVSLKVLLD